MRWLLVLAAALLVVPMHLSLSSPLPLAEQAAVLWRGSAETLAEVTFLHGGAPRAVIALLAGAGLGLAGSVMQQVTRNPLVSPLTLGTSAGAWLALVIASVAAPALAASHGVWFAMTGAILSTGLVLAIAGRQGIGGLPVVLAGMAMTLLLQAVATVVVLTHDQYVRNLFIWQAGDLGQTDWRWVTWLAPQVAAGLVVVVLCKRPLTLMRLGAEAAAARGLALIPFLLVAVLAALWLTASVITAVGVIAFIGLLAPNLARLCGARSAAAELVTSLILGAVLLLATDALALYASRFTRDLVPSGASAALVGVPVLLWLTLRRLRAADHAPLSLPVGALRVSRLTWAALAVAAVALPLLALTVGRGPAGWSIGWPSDLVLGLRWPRVLTAAAAGAGMAVAGVILQRLLRNPLASPDIIGISSGASLALVATVVVLGGSIHEAGVPVALLGGLAALAVLLLLGRRQGHAPNAVALVGIALAALLDSLLQFALARGGDEAYMIIGWLAGSTFRASAGQGMALAAAVAAAAAATLLAHRWLTLMAAGEPFAAARGLAVGPARMLLLALGAMTAAAVTSVTGPIAFVGLIAPHMAVLLGARKVAAHVVLATVLGAVLLVASDWLGRTVFHPVQLPAGAVAAVVGGGYFIALLAGQGPLRGLRGLGRMASGWGNRAA
ncbi:Fe(3+)-hydroxamate ABC transporter permease FhuB [Caenispirillum bisanense]|uniref:Fe(3+)-hydroxamate ABC transporter permease FhuB n=1 Tax=Caenispirillum bisanense TaxID=414052 RepID=UPI0031D7E300